VIGIGVSDPETVGRFLKRGMLGAHDGDRDWGIVFEDRLIIPGNDSTISVKIG
jgi:hypothetical protein